MMLLPPCFTVGMVPGFQTLSGLSCNNDGGHCVFGDLQCCRYFWVPFPRSGLDTILYLSSTDNSLDLRIWFLL
jgi:hypothetical protein